MVEPRLEAVKRRVKKNLGDDFEVMDPSSSTLGEDFETAPGPGAEAKPAKGVGTKVFERFWGTDVQDPVEYPRLGAQLVLGTSGAVAGAQLGAAGGAVVGGPVGAGIGAAAGGIIGGAAGALAGTVAPETLMETAEYLGIAAPETRKKLGLNDEELRTVVEGEMLLDMVTGGALIGARGLVRGGIKAITGAGKGGRKIADYAAEKGINMLPVQVGDRAIPRGFISVLGKFPIVASPIRSRIHNSEKMFKEAFENLPPSIAPLATMDSVSHRVLMDAKHTFKRFSDDFGKQYEQVFKRADDAGAVVTPQSTFDKTQEILKNIERETPAAAGKKKATHSAAMEEVKSFLTDELGPMFRTTKSGASAIADQSYTQMNTILTKIDSKIGDIAKNESAGAKQAIDRLQGLKNSISLDMYQNGNGPFANAIGMEIRGLDKKYSETMADLFETSAAKKFGTVKRGGLKEFNFDPNTRTNVDNLTEVLMRGESLEELSDLKKLVQPRTFKELAAGILDKRIASSYGPSAESGMQRLDLDKLGRNLGLDNPKGKRYLHMEKLLDLAGGMKMDDVKKLVEVGGKIAAVDAPNSSVFLTRRVTMGGLSAFVGTFTGMQAGMGSVKGLAASLTGMVTIMGGAHLVGRMITDPLAARSLSLVLKPETTKVARKAAILRAAQIAIRGAVDAAQWTEDEGMNLYGNIKNATDAIVNQPPSGE